MVAHIAWLEVMVEVIELVRKCDEVDSLASRYTLNLILFDIAMKEYFHLSVPIGPCSMSTIYRR
jgi:hypothetical protein